LKRLNQLRGFFLYFGPVRFTAAELTSSTSFPLPSVAYPPTDVATPCHTFFSLNQDKLVNFASSSGNASSRRISFGLKIEILNLHYHNRPPSLNRSTPTLYYYKKIISSVATLPAHHSTVPSFYLLISQSITSSKLHPPLLFSFIVVLCPSYLYTMTLTLTN
jgi:hypothetical protein